jgi:putative oxidoreductase
MNLDRICAAYQPHVLSLFRFITGLLLFQYGVAKIFKFPALPYFADIPPLIITAGALEFVVGGLLMIGLFTRISAFILAGQMAFAYFLGHMFKSGEPVFLPLINGGTAAILFCFACLYLSISRWRTVERRCCDGRAAQASSFRGSSIHRRRGMTGEYLTPEPS